ncbi:hypothetical protein Gpo141_00005887 [Globisporangium polare]
MGMATAGAAALSAQEDIAVRREHNKAQARMLAGDASGGSAGGSVSSELCHDAHSFLGVGNTRCLHENIGTAVFLLGIIVVVSILFDRLIHFVRHSIHCPQLSKIVDRIFQEVMIMGFISMVIFTLNTSGVMKKMNFAVDALTPTEQLHFYEFFHYIVFLTMIYFIVIVLLLLFIGTVVPKLIWTAHDAEGMENEYEDNLDAAFGTDRDDDGHDDDGDDDGLYFDRTLDGSEDRFTRGDVHSGSRRHPTRTSTLRRAKSGMDLVQGSRAYSLLLERYQREGWCFRFNLQKQWHFWKSFEILAYNICQNRSGYIYKNPDEMERLFGVKPPSRSQNLLRPEPEQIPMSYARYHVLCMRNLLYHITDLHYSALFILLVISVLPSLYPSYDHWIFLGVGGVLLLVNFIILFKVLKILRGIVDDRLRVITMRDIRTRLADIQSANEDSYTGALTPSEQDKAAEAFITMPPKRLTLKTVALGVRAIIRMQMSALCHRQLHYHDDRFWFDSPKLMLRMFQFATISQAFYLVWLSLVAAPTIVEKDNAVFLLPLMVLLPLLSLCIITPMTMPSLVLVMSLTGIFVDLNSEPSRTGRKVPYEVAKTRIRLMRRSFLKSHYSDNDDLTRFPGSPAIQERNSNNSDTVSSPTNVFLRIYDSPKAAAVHIKLGTEMTSPTNSATRGSMAEQREDSTANLLSRKSGGSSSLGRSRGREETNGYSGPRRSFNLAAFQTSANPSVLSSIYQSPRKHADGNNNNSAAANWSQAHFDTGSTEAARTGNDPNSSSNNSIAVDPSPSPAAEPFKSYCSKYGGYPEA